MKPGSPVVIQKHANHSSARAAQKWHPVCHIHLLRFCAHAFLGLLLFVLPSFPQTSTPESPPSVAPSDAGLATPPEPGARDRHPPPDHAQPGHLLPDRH